MWKNIKPRHIAFRAHDQHVITCLQFDGDKIIAGSDNASIRVYDTKSGVLRATLKGHEGGIWGLEYHGNTLVSGSTDRSIRIWDIARAECTQVLQGHTSTVRSIQLLLPVCTGQHINGTPVMMPEQPLIISGSRDSSLRVWKLPHSDEPRYSSSNHAQSDEKCPYLIHILTGHQHTVRAITAYGDTLVSGSYDCTVRVWKVSTGEPLHRLQSHKSKVYSVSLDHERNRCISGSMDHTIKIWSLDTGSLLYNLEGHSSLVGLIDLKEDVLVSAAADKTLKIWDPASGKCQNTLCGHAGAVTCFQHDGQKVISGSDKELKLWNTRTAVCERVLLTDLSGVWHVRFNSEYCIAAVQRGSSSYIEILDFSVSPEAFPSGQLETRILVDELGNEIGNPCSHADR